MPSLSVSSLLPTATNTRAACKHGPPVCSSVGFHFVGMSAIHMIYIYIYVYSYVRIGYLIFTCRHMWGYKVYDVARIPKVVHRWIFSPAPVRSKQYKQPVLGPDYLSCWRRALSKACSAIIPLLVCVRARVCVPVCPRCAYRCMHRHHLPC